jgi:hypothetical protein
VFEKLVRQEKLPVRLTIVSSLRIENYAAQETERMWLGREQKLRRMKTGLNTIPSFQRGNADPDARGGCGAAAFLRGYLRVLRALNCRLAVLPVIYHGYPCAAGD